MIVAGHSLPGRPPAGLAGSRGLYTQAILCQRVEPLSDATSNWQLALAVSVGAAKLLAAPT
jgi:hypothetical protein